MAIYLYAMSAGRNVSEKADKMRIKRWSTGCRSRRYKW